MTTHLLKILPEYFKAVKDGSKTFEIRKNDRDFRTGDTVCLYVSEAVESLIYKIGFICDYEQKEGYVVFSLLPIEEGES